MIATQTLLDLFTATRQKSEEICAPLETEDYVVQPIVDVSPPKWHLGHTTWFFEEFILRKFVPAYKLFNPDFAYIFNSYYETIGKRVVRANRGNLSRPGVEEVYAYRTHVTQAMQNLLNHTTTKEAEELITIGIHHEKQHQELLFTDIKYILGNNPLLPAYDLNIREHYIEPQPQDWIHIPAGTYEIGHATDDFCYDNEQKSHKVYLQFYQLSSKLVTNGEFIAFIDAGGYKSFKLWHAEGWDWVNQNNICSPLYWHHIDGVWHHYTLQGLQPVNPESILTHISYYEAFAYAQWKGMRLPTEFEWEVASGQLQWGQLWEWTASAYQPYPNFKKADGALGEYNGKFMVNQQVLRGASVATPQGHSRRTYRNFFHPEMRWMFSGIRLVK